MIRMVQSQSSGHAKAYFSEALVKSDYYLAGQDQEISGRLQGNLAERLGLAGPIDKETFFALCENRTPGTQEPLTPRTKVARTVGYDINFHCPKSVSVLHALSNDDHILEAFKESVHQTMQDIEQDTFTRVRKDGLEDERHTGELAWVDFVHMTSRPVEDAVPDPHLHAHCFVFNATWDGVEQRAKAAQFREIQRSMPYYEARFHKRLSDQLTKLGYQVHRTDKSFEIAGVPKNVVDHFSKRSDQIGRIAKEKGITDTKALSELGARTRAKKQKGHTMAELKANWRQQIRELKDNNGTDGRQAVRHAPVKDKQLIAPKQCIDHTLLHSFERASVMSERRLLAKAYRHGIGHTEASLDAIDQTFQKDERMIHVVDKGQTLTTTREVLAEERRMVSLAQQGQGKLKPLYMKTPELSLMDQQAEAVSHVLTTTNRVSIIRGVAGSGKTTLMREAISHIEKAGNQVMVVAPTAQASRGVLREEGFENATTVAQLLADPKQQQSLQGQVLWVDEAGLLGTKDMTALLSLATDQNARLILGGDTLQHASVIRGDALRILNTVGGLQAAEVSRIYRQRDAHYKKAVEELSKGDVATAFETLDGIGSIKSVDPMTPNDALVQDYVNAVKRGKSTLIISPTHEQGDEVTKAVREKLQSSGLLHKKENPVSRLRALNLTEAQKLDSRNLKTGQIIQFNQNRPGIKRGSQWTIEVVSDKNIVIKNSEKEEQNLSLHKSSDFEVYESGTIALAKKDKVRISRNGFDLDGNRLNNGQSLEVVRFTKQDELILRNPTSKVNYRLAKDHGHLAHDYCVTSPTSQGKTVDEVFIHQPAGTFVASNAKQFYVSVSRGRDKAHIYTDDRVQLLEHASKLGNRQSAMELVERQDQIKDTVEQQIRNDLTNDRTVSPLTKQPEKSRALKEPDYEPRI